ncbi:MAG: hypothetical protein HQ559_04065 [Lentisphaerae bacterium]|nr:hypothetical protein [Lentisphaerota bacterium]
MRSRSHHFTPAIITAVCFTLALAFVPHADADDFVWDGNGNTNNGGNWSAPLNWDADSGYPDNSGDTADLQAVLTSPRYITNDVAVTVGTIVMEDDTDHHLVLGANLTVDVIDGPHNKYDSTIHVNGYTFTVGQSIGPGGYMPKIDGPGKIVKVSANTVTLQGTDTYTGSIIVSNGVLSFRSSQWDTTTLMTVIDGGTASLQEPGPSFPTNIVINGHGYNAGGALAFQYTSDSCASDITVGSDSKMKRLAGTTTLTGDISGTDVLTLEGPGVFLFSESSYSFSGTLWVTNGTVSVPGELTSVTNIVVKNGGTLIGTIAHFPSVVDGGVTNITEEGSGEWQQIAVGIWTGNGNPDNSGNWSDPNNWSGGEVPTYQAILPNPSVDRYITNDVASSVTILQMEEDGSSLRNHLVVMAPMTVGTYDPKAPEGYRSQVDNYSTVTISNHTSTYAFDTDKGTGTYVLNGSWWQAQSSGTFSGNWIVSNGTLHVRSADASTWSGVTVLDGATVYFTRVNWNSAEFITINGSGAGTYGALYHNTVTHLYSNLTVATDAVLENTVTMTFQGGAISGPGDLTKLGAGTLDIDNTYNFAIDGAEGNKMIASAGTIDISGGTLTVSGEGSATESEYVVIDFSGAGGVSGEFLIENLPDGWLIDYDGTDDNLECVVVELPPPGVVILIR